MATTAFMDGSKESNNNTTSRESRSSFFSYINNETKDSVNISLKCSKVLQEMLTIDLWHDMIESSKLLFGTSKDYEIFMTLAKNFWNDDDHGEVFIYQNGGASSTTTTVNNSPNAMDVEKDDLNTYNNYGIYKNDLTSSLQPPTFIHNMHKKVYNYQCRKGNPFCGIQLNYTTISKGVTQGSNIKIPEIQHEVKPIFDLFHNDNLPIFSNIQNNLSTKAALELNKPYNCGLNIYGEINKSIINKEDNNSFDITLSDNFFYEKKIIMDKINPYYTSNWIFVDAFKKGSDTFRGIYQEREYAERYNEPSRFPEGETTATILDEANALLHNINNSNVLQPIPLQLKQGNDFKKPINCEFKNHDNETIVVVEQTLKTDVASQEEAQKKMNQLLTIKKLYANFLNNIISTKQRYLNFAQELFNFYTKFKAIYTDDPKLKNAPGRLESRQINGPAFVCCFSNNRNDNLKLIKSTHTNQLLEKNDQLFTVTDNIVPLSEKMMQMMEPQLDLNLIEKILKDMDINHDNIIQYDELTINLMYFNYHITKLKLSNEEFKWWYEILEENQEEDDILWKKCLYLSFKWLKNKFYFIKNKLLFYEFKYKFDGNYKSIRLKEIKDTTVIQTFKQNANENDNIVSLMFEHFKIGDYNDPYKDLPSINELDAKNFDNTFFHINELIIRDNMIEEQIIEMFDNEDKSPSFNSLNKHIHDELLQIIQSDNRYYRKNEWDKKNDLFLKLGNSGSWQKDKVEKLINDIKKIFQEGENDKPESGAAIITQIFAQFKSNKLNYQQKFGSTVNIFENEILSQNTKVAISRFVSNNTQDHKRLEFENNIIETSKIYNKSLPDRGKKGWKKGQLISIIENLKSEIEQYNDKVKKLARDSGLLEYKNICENLMKLFILDTRINTNDENQNNDKVPYVIDFIRKRKLIDEKTNEFIGEKKILTLRKNSIVYWALEYEIPIIEGFNGIQSIKIKDEGEDYTITMKSLSVSECSYKFKWLLVLFNYIFFGIPINDDVKQKIGQKKGTRTNKADQENAQYFFDIINKISKERAELSPLDKVENDEQRDLTGTLKGLGDFLDEDVINICTNLIKPDTQVPPKTLLKILYLPLFSKTMADFFQMLYVKHLMQKNRENNIGYNNNFWLMTFDIMAALIGLEIECPILFEKEIKGIRTALIGYAINKDSSIMTSVETDTLSPLENQSIEVNNYIKNKFIDDTSYFFKKDEWMRLKGEYDGDTALNINYCYDKKYKIENKLKKIKLTEVGEMNVDTVISNIFDVIKNAEIQILKTKLKILSKKHTNSKLYKELKECIEYIFKYEEMIKNELTHLQKSQTTNFPINVYNNMIDYNTKYISSYTNHLLYIMDNFEKIENYVSYKNIIMQLESRLKYFQERSGNLPSSYLFGNGSGKVPESTKSVSLKEKERYMMKQIQIVKEKAQEILADPEIQKVSLKRINTHKLGFPTTPDQPINQELITSQHNIAPDDRWAVNTTPGVGSSDLKQKGKIMMVDDETIVEELDGNMTSMYQFRGDGSNKKSSSSSSSSNRSRRRKNLGKKKLVNRRLNTNDEDTAMRMVNPKDQTMSQSNQPGKKAKISIAFPPRNGTVVQANDGIKWKYEQHLDTKDDDTIRLWKEGSLESDVVTEDIFYSSYTIPPTEGGAKLKIGDNKNSRKIKRRKHNTRKLKIGTKINKSIKNRRKKNDTRRKKIKVNTI
ncbi:MAG: hypothetical protein CBC84_002345 [Pelagibacteraceae bacterium TMED124]|nr:MAG: hypothetical protein CBC84_002345 [Pelagibacteraceae bacterium TMED124]